MHFYCPVLISRNHQNPFFSFISGLHSIASFRKFNSGQSYLKIVYRVFFLCFSAEEKRSCPINRNETEDNGNFFSQAHECMTWCFRVNEKSPFRSRLAKGEILERIPNNDCRFIKELRNKDCGMDRNKKSA